MIQYDLQGNCYELGIRGDKEMNEVYEAFMLGGQEIEKLRKELQRKDNIINELKEKINQFTLIIGYYDYNDEGNDEIGENNNLQEELLNIINLDKIIEIEGKNE